jgi:FAD/FMN-containing dehydrogenase
LSGLPGIQKRAATAFNTSARWIVHRMPQQVQWLPSEFFGNARDAVPSIVEIKDFMFAEQSAAVIPLDLNLDDRYLKAWVTPPTKTRRSAQDGAVRRHCRRRCRDVVARAQPPRWFVDR